MTDEEAVYQARAPLDFGLFAKPRPVTSMAAHRAIQPKAGSQKAHILKFLRVGPSTRKQLAEDLGLTVSSTNPRCRELIDANLIHEGGTRAGESILHYGPKP